MSAPEPEAFDSVVVGAGPAGATGALYLARLRRSVLLIDGGNSRATGIPRSHNYPGFPGGVVGAELVAAIQRQAADHGVRSARAAVTSIARRGEAFAVAFDGRMVSARTVLLATGASDIEPDMAELAQAIDEGALHYCPVCDGFEVIDTRVGVLVNGADGLREALYLRQFTPHVEVFAVPGGGPFADADRARLREAGVAIRDGAVDALLLRDGCIEVHHRGATTLCDSVYSALGMKVHSALAVAAGAAVDEDGYLQTDEHHMTRVEGLYAAGDVASGLNQISVATGGAAIAAAAMHLAMGGAHR